MTFYWWYEKVKLVADLSLKVGETLSVSQHSLSFYWEFLEFIKRNCKIFQNFGQFIFRYEPDIPHPNSAKCQNASIQWSVINIPDGCCFFEGDGCPGFLGFSLSSVSATRSSQLNWLKKFLSFARCSRESLIRKVLFSQGSWYQGRYVI